MNQQLVTLGFILLGLVVTLLPVAFYVQAGGDSMMRIGTAVLPGLVGFCGGYLYRKNFTVVESTTDGLRQTK